MRKRLNDGFGVLLILVLTRTISGLKDGYIRKLDYLCFSQETRLQALPWDCSGFVQCVFKWASWRNCPDGMVFNPELQTCGRRPATGPCRFPEERAKTFCPSMRSLTFPHPKNCAMYYDCSKDSDKMGLRKYEKECRYPMLFDKFDLVCKYPNEAHCGQIPRPRSRCIYQLECFDTACKHLPDGNNVVAGKLFQADYVVCKDWLVIERTKCTGGTVFDAVSLQCTSDASAAISMKCKQTPHLKFPTPDSCAMRYDCQQERWHPLLKSYLRECPYYQLWDVKTRRCTHFKNVDCGERKEPKAPCDYITGHCASGICIPCEASCIGQRDGRVVMPGDNSTYLECKSERTTRIQHCPRNYVFYVSSCIDPSLVPQTTSVGPMSTNRPDLTSTMAPATFTSTTGSTSTYQYQTTATSKATSVPTTMVTTGLTTSLSSTTETSTTGTTPTPTTCAVTLTECERNSKIVELERILKLGPARDNRTCRGPPHLSRSQRVSLTHEHNQTVASYSCKPGFTLCGGRHQNSCTGGTWGSSDVMCVQNIWGGASLPVTGTMSCPLTTYSRITFWGTLTSFENGAIAFVDPQGRGIAVLFNRTTSSPYHVMTVTNQEGREAVGDKRTAFPGEEIVLKVYLSQHGYHVLLKDEALIIPYTTPRYAMDTFRVSGALAGNKLEFNPSNVIEFTSIGHTVTHLSDQGYTITDGTFVTFGVEACDEVTIYLSEEADHLDEQVVVVKIWGTPSSVIQMQLCKTCPLHTGKHGFTDCRHSKQFWIFLPDKDGTQQVNMGEGYLNTGPVLMSSPRPGGGIFKHMHVESTGSAFWSMSHPLIERCGLPQPMVHAVMGMAGPESPDRIRLVCEPGYFFCGKNSMLTCRDGLWSGVHGQCVRAVITQEPAEGVYLHPCKIGIDSAISIHMDKDAMIGNPIRIYVYDLSGDLALLVELEENRLYASSVLGGVKTGAVNKTVSGTIAEGNEYHVVIYSTHGSFKVYLDGKLELVFPYQSNWDALISTTVVPTNTTIRVEFATQVKENHSCDVDPIVSNAIFEPKDRTLGAEIALNCTQPFLFCGTNPNFRCTGSGRWSGPDGECIMLYYDNAETLARKQTYDLPPCLHEAITTNISITGDFSSSTRNGHPFTIELHHSEPDVEIFSFTIDFSANILRVNPGQRALPVQTGILLDKVQIHLNISDDNIEILLGRNSIGSIPFRFPRTSFRTLAYQGRGTVTILRVVLNTSMLHSQTVT